MARDACVRVCQLSALEVTQYSYVGKFKRPTSSFLLLFLLLLSYFRLLSLSFLLHAPSFSSPTSIYLLLVYLKCHWQTQLLRFLFSYLFPRERYRTFETTHRIFGQIKRRKSTAEKISLVRSDRCSPSRNDGSKIYRPKSWNIKHLLHLRFRQQTANRLRLPAKRAIILVCIELDIWSFKGHLWFI